MTQRPDLDPLRPSLDRAWEELRAGRFEAAEASYRKVLASAPDHPHAKHFLGMCLVRTGRVDEGLALVEGSMAQLGGEARYRESHGLMLAQAGRLDAAERELQAAVALDPTPVSYLYLGLLQQQLGRLSDAGVAFRAGIARAPDDAALQASYGNCLLGQGDAAGAIDWLGRAIGRDPGNAAVHSDLGNALAAAGRRDAAIASYRKAAALEPGFAPAWYNLGLALQGAGDEDGAFEAFRRAVWASADFAPAWQAYASRFARGRFVAWDAGVARELTQVLLHPAIDPGPLAAAAASLLALDPQFAPAMRAIAGDAEPPDARVGGVELAQLAHPMLIALIENALVPDPAFEAFLRALRRRVLEAWASGEPSDAPAAIDLVCALAQQCFLNEYVWPEEAAETALVQSLSAHDVLRIALLACYRPLAATPDLVRPSAASEAFERLWQRQVTEPAEARRLREAIPVLTPIDDATSRAVQSQYEENPYPRWHRLPASVAVAFPLRRAVRELFPHVDPARFRISDPPDILIAGCGTGQQTAIAAARNPSGRILAVDLSRTSLAYAMRRLGTLGLGNVRFAQADLLRLGTLPERFDLIECTGVLHHLRDPLAGWRVLLSLLKDGGVMKVALYSERARRGVVAARTLIAEAGIGDALEDIRRARALVLAQPPGSPFRPVPLGRDFFCASGVRDLLLHVQEHRFTIPGLVQALDALGLEFLGFEFVDPAVLLLYRQRFPADRSATSLDNWAAFEEGNPDAFAGMYQFWVTRRAG